MDKSGWVDFDKLRPGQPQPALAWVNEPREAWPADWESRIPCTAKELDKAEAFDRRAEQDDAERPALLAQLGISADAAWMGSRFPGSVFGKPWQHYEVQVLGLTLLPAPAERPPGPVAVLHTPDGVLMVELRLRRVRYVGSPMWAEARWRPDDPQGVWFGTLERPGSPEPTKTDRSRTHQALRLLKDVRAWQTFPGEGEQVMVDWRGGRPTGTGTFRDAADFEARVTATLVALLKEGSPTTQEKFAEYWDRQPPNRERRHKAARDKDPLSASQVSRWCRQYMRPWSDLVRRAEAQFAGDVPAPN